MAAMGEMLKRRPMRKTQSLDEFAGQSFCPSPTAVTDKNARFPNFEGGSPGLKRKTRSIESKEKRGMEAAKVKAMEDHSDMLFVTALECMDLAPFVKVSKGLFSSDRKSKETQVEGSIHLAFQLSSAVRRSDHVCVAGMTQVHNVAGTGRIDEEYVFDIPGGTVALQVSCLMRKYTGKRKYHQETLIGHCSIPLDRLPESGDVEQWYSFKHPTDDTQLKAAVKLKLKLEVSTSHDIPESNAQDLVVSPEPEPVVHHTHAHAHPPHQTMDRRTRSGDTPLLTSGTTGSGGTTLSERTLSTNSIEEDEEWWRRQVVTSGLVDFIAIIRGGANVKGHDGILRPEACVTERWPEGDTPDGEEFPQKVEWFCFAGGWEPVPGRKRSEAGSASSGQSKTEKPMPRIETFGVQIGGARAWGVCLIDHELNNRNEEEMWWPVGTLLLTRLPIIEALKLWLSEFYYFLGRQAGNNQLLSSVLAPYFMQLLVTVPRPVDNVLAIRFDPFGPDSRRIVVDVAAPHGLPPFGFNLHASISCLGPKAIVELLGHALGERKMLLHSSDISTITPLAEALCCLLYPLQWSHAYVPVLPKVMLEILEAPQPYIVGIHSDWLAEIDGSSLEDVVIVDIDRGSVEAFEDSLLGIVYKKNAERDAEERGWGMSSSNSAPISQTHALPAAVELNLRLLISDYLIHGDLPLDDANAPLFAPSSSESEFRVADMLSQGARVTPLQLSVRSDSAASVQLRLAFAAQFAVLLAGFEQCIYWVDAGFPVFDEKRFLDDFNSPKETQALTQLLNTQMFQQLLENFDDPDLVPFHSLVHHVDIDAKRLHGSGVGGLAAARHKLTVAPLDPAAPCSRVAAIARAARFKAPQPGSGGCCRYTLVVPYMKLDEHKRARSRWSAAAGALQKKHHSFASGGHHRTVGFPSETLILTGVLDEAVTSLGERTKSAFESARGRERDELSQETMEREGGGRFRWKSEPPPLPEDGTVWTVGSVADSSGAPVAQLVQPPVPELDFDHDLLVGADESSTSLITKKVPSLTRSTSVPVEQTSDASSLNKFGDVPTHSSFNVTVAEPSKEPMSCRPSLAKNPMQQGGDMFDKFEEAALGEVVRTRTPSKAPRRGAMVVSKVKSEGNKSDDEEKNEDLTADEQQLTRCVALALSARDGPPKDLMEECVRTIGQVPELSQRLVKILTRMRKHAARRKAAETEIGKTASGGSISGFRLPCPGFETLATLCHAVLKTCGARKEYDPPYTLLRLTGAYYQKLKDPTDAENDELEYLSSRLSENPIYSDLGLWEFVLSKDLKISKAREGEELSVADKRAVVQRVTLLLYSMRGIGMTPHRAVMLVRSVVSKYALSQRQWRQLHGVVCTVWKDASLPAFNKLGFVSTTTSIDEESASEFTSPTSTHNPLTDGVNVETKTTPVAPRKLYLEEVDDKSWQYGEDADAIGNCSFFLGGGGAAGPPNRRRTSLTPDMMAGGFEEVKEERNERVSAGDAVLPLSTSESTGTMTCVSMWGDKAVFGGTDSTVRCLQLPFSARLKREESTGGFNIPNLEVMITHQAPVTCVSLLDPYIISGDSSGTVKLSFPFDSRHPNEQVQQSKGIFSSPASKLIARCNVTTLSGHTSPITAIGIPRLSGGSDGPVEGIPSPGLEVPLVATGSLDGVVRVWNLAMAKEEKTPSAWATFEPAKKESKGFVPFPTSKSNLQAARAVRSLQLDSWGRWIASGTNDGCVRLLDIGSEACVGEVFCHTAAVRAVRFKGGNNNRILSVSNDRTCCLTDPRAHSFGFAGSGSGKESSATMLQFLGHGAPVTCLDEGNESDPIFFTGSADCRVMVWDARTSKLPMWVWDGHEGTVMSVRSFGSIVVSAGEDGSVCEWNVKTGKLMMKHRCPAPIIATASSGGRFVASTWAQRLHVFTFDSRRPSIVRTPVSYSPGMAPPSPHSGGRINPTWNPTMSLTSPTSSEASLPALTPPFDIHPPPKLGSPHDIHPPPKLGSPRQNSDDEDDRFIREKGIKEFKDSEKSDTSGKISMWEKMGGSPLGQLASVNEGVEVDKRTSSSSSDKSSELQEPKNQKRILHKKHAPIQVEPPKSALTLEIEKETVTKPKSGEGDEGRESAEVVRSKPKLKSATPKGEAPTSGRSKPKLKSSLKHDNSVPPPPSSLESGSRIVRKVKRVSMANGVSEKEDKDKMDLMDTLITTRRTRSHTPGKSLGLAAAQRGAVVQEPSRHARTVSGESELPDPPTLLKVDTGRSPRKKTVKSPRESGEGVTVVRSRRIRSKDSPSTSPRENSAESNEGITVVRSRKIKSKESPSTSPREESAESKPVKSFRTVRIRSKSPAGPPPTGAPLDTTSGGTLRSEGAKVRSRSPDSLPPPAVSMLTDDGLVKTTRIKSSQSSSPVPQRPVIKRSPRNSDKPLLNAAAVASLGGTEPLDRVRADSVSSDISEMATGLEAFTRGAKLSMHFEAMNQQGITELEHLDKVDDGVLIELGMKKPEVKRLRRYLKRVLAL